MAQCWIRQDAAAVPAEFCIASDTTWEDKLPLFVFRLRFSRRPLCISPSSMRAQPARGSNNFFISLPPLLGIHPPRRVPNRPPSGRVLDVAGTVCRFKLRISYARSEWCQHLMTAVKWLTVILLACLLLIGEFCYFYTHRKKSSCVRWRRCKIDGYFDESLQKGPTRPLPYPPAHAVRQILEWPAVAGEHTIQHSTGRNPHRVGQLLVRSKFMPSIWIHVLSKNLNPCATSFRHQRI